MARNPVGSVAPLTTVLCSGFGSSGLYCDGEQVVDGEAYYGRLTLRLAERIARNRPGVWEAEVYGPLWSAKWRREEPGRWACVEAGKGFA